MLFRKITFSFYCVLYTSSIYSQINLFNLTPRIINGINEQSVFYHVVADSNFIYVLGDYPYIKDSVLGITDIQAYLAKFNYQGEKYFRKILILILIHFMLDIDHYCKEMIIEILIIIWWWWMRIK